MSAAQPLLGPFALVFEDALAVPISFPAEEPTSSTSGAAHLPAHLPLRPGVASLERWLDLCA